MNSKFDQVNKGHMIILKSLFPEQMKTTPRIIAWTIVFMLDVIIGVFCAAYFGLLPGSTLVTGIVIAAIVTVFWLQGVVWYALVKFFQKRNELG